jgi:Cys-tRNA(Pro)/Cys-tRNA(Cys) deacylase
MKKTNAARILDRLKVNYELIEYEVDENDLSAVHVAETAGVPIERIYKTLVLQGDKNGIFVCIVPGGKEIDLKKAAFISLNKKAAMIKMNDLEPLTGYIRGGCSPLGMKKNYPIFIDQSAFNQSFIYISAGIRGMQIKIAPLDLVSATKAIKADLVEEESNNTLTFASL